MASAEAGAPGAGGHSAAAAAAATARVDAPLAPSPAEPRGAGEHDADSRNFDHLRALFTQTPASLAGNVIGWGLVLLIFAPLARAQVLWPWLIALAMMLALRLAHYMRFLRQRDAGNETWRQWRTSWKALVLGQAAMWGLAVWLFWGLGSAYHNMALMLIVFSYSVASVPLLATQQRLFMVFTCIVLGPAIVRIASDDTQEWHWQMSGILCLQFVVVMIMGRMQRSALDQVIHLKAHTDRLAAQLRVEGAAADAARRSAEAANRAKTQFFAAASHDLRQPLHAMGLFAEALRQRSHDPEVASLVNSINESVDALEGLFGELLDITRIDTGGVEVHLGPVRLAELFARLKLHFEPVAFEKGLALSFHGAQRVAHADGVIVERMLRNLVSNAIRYTEDGGVLVACRVRGCKLLLQVWDSGIGIAESALPLIFDEFFQVSSNQPLQPHHRKGLGLGLAIVARLGAMMDAPVRVRSRAGRGTVFEFELPAGQAVAGAAPKGAVAKAALGLTLQGRSFVLVEDEPAVREGLLVLLKAWGAQVHAFDTVDAVQAWLASGAAQQPDLLLVDYRLPQGRTGLDAMASLRAHWPRAQLPAIVITGSTIGGHESEAAEHDFHLLIKPVLPNKLRAMIGFKLGVRS